MKRSSIAGMGADIYLAVTPNKPNTPPVQEQAQTTEKNIEKPEKVTIYLSKAVSDQLIDAVARRKKTSSKSSKSGIIEEALSAWFRQQDSIASKR